MASIIVSILDTETETIMDLIHHIAIELRTSFYKSWGPAEVPPTSLFQIAHLYAPAAPLFAPSVYAPGQPFPIFSPSLFFRLGIKPFYWLRCQAT